MKIMQHIWLERPDRRTKKLTLVAPPFADAGDTVKLDGVPWSVKKVSSVRGIVNPIRQRKPKA